MRSSTLFDQVYSSVDNDLQKNSKNRFRIPSQMGRYSRSSTRDSSNQTNRRSSRSLRRSHSHISLCSRSRRTSSSSSFFLEFDRTRFRQWGSDDPRCRRPPLTSSGDGRTYRSSHSSVPLRTFRHVQTNLSTLTPFDSHVSNLLDRAFYNSYETSLPYDGYRIVWSSRRSDRTHSPAHFSRTLHFRFSPCQPPGSTSRLIARWIRKEFRKGGTDQNGGMGSQRRVV